MSDRLIAIAIGDSIDRETLGFPDREIKRVLFAVCTAFIRRGYRIAYAGDLHPDGYTYAMFEFLSGTYAGQGKTPFAYIVPGSVSDGLDFDKAIKLVQQTRGIASISLVRDGQSFNLSSANNKLLIGSPGPQRVTARNDEEWKAFLDLYPYKSNADALTDARRTIASLASGCVAMGGKMGRVGFSEDQFQGAMPGIVEEALMYLKAGKPFVPLAAFGGATRDIAISLGLLQKTEQTPRLADNHLYLAALTEIATFLSHFDACHLLKKAAREENAEEVAQIALEVMDTLSPAPYPAPLPFDRL